MGNFEEKIYAALHISAVKKASKHSKDIFSACH